MSLDLEQPEVILDSAAGTPALPETADTPNEPESGSDDGLLNTEQQTIDEIEEELEGVKLRGPKESLERLKAERLMQADYTRKTQEVAEQRRAFEAQQTQFQETAKAHQANLQEVAQLVAIDDRLRQFSQINWQQLTDTDAVQALKLHTEFTQLQAARGQLANSLTQKQQAQAQEQQRSHAKQLMEARQVLERDIPGWGPELAGKVTDFALSMGFPEQVLGQITQAPFVKALHKAYMFDQLEKKQKAKPAAAPTPPATRVGGANASSTKKLSDMSVDEFVEARRKFIKSHR